MKRIPEPFISGVIAERGDAGSDWIEDLPNKIDKYCALWNLEIDGEPMHGYIGLVLPVRRGNEKCVLKVSWVDDETRHEALALRLWNGEGAVKLVDANSEEGVLLLERLDASRSLSDVDIDEAIKIAGRLLRRLAIPAPAGIPSVHQYAERQAQSMKQRWQELGCPFPEEYITSAQNAAREVGPSAQHFLVNQDLHYENVLPGEREPWLVIDPKVIAGDVEFGAAPLLWNRLEEDIKRIPLARRFQILIDSAALDVRRTWCWTVLRCVDYWVWALSVGLSEDPKRCRSIIQWLLESSRMI